MSEANPFKGPDAYREGDSFFGRENEINELYNLVRLNLLTLFYARSGHGKTSLIQAGLIPLLRGEREFLPVYIRLPETDLKQQKSGDFTSYTIALLQKEIKKYSKEWCVVKQDKIFNPDSLFETVMSTAITANTVDAETRETISERVTPVFIFDQFEEIFSKEFESGDITGLLTQIGYLLNNQLPPDLNNVLRNDANIKDRIRILDRMKSKDRPFRIIFSFREEYIPFFESLKEIPPVSLTNSRYRLDAFTQSNAEQVILDISQQKISSAYSKFVCDELGKKQTPLAAHKSVEPLLLSLSCYKAYQELIKENQSEETIRDMVKNAIDNYVDAIMKSISDKTKNFIEQKLITTEGRRTPYSYQEAIRLCPKKEIENLIDEPGKRLLSKQQYLDSLHIEVLHDRLANSIFKKKKEREEFEIQQAVEVRLKKSSQKHRYERIFTAIFYVAVFGLISFFWYRNHQSQKLMDLIKQDSLKHAQDSLLRIDSAKTATDFREFAQAVYDSSDNSNNSFSIISGADKYIKGVAIFHVSDSPAIIQMQRCVDSLKSMGFVVPKPEIISRVKFDNLVKYFHPEDAVTAKKVVTLCNRLYTKPFRLIPPEESKNKIKPGAIEIWLNYEPYINLLFSADVVTRKSAYQFVTKKYREHPQWIPAMVNLCLEHSDNNNGVFNTLSALSVMSPEFLTPYKEEIAKIVFPNVFGNRVQIRNLALALAKNINLSVTGYADYGALSQKGSWDKRYFDNHLKNLSPPQRQEIVTVISPVAVRTGLGRQSGAKAPVVQSEIGVASKGQMYRVLEVNVIHQSLDIYSIKIEPVELERK